MHPFLFFRASPRARNPARIMMEIAQQTLFARVGAPTQFPALPHLVAFGSARAQKCFAHGTDSILVGESHHLYERMDVQRDIGIRTGVQQFLKIPHGTFGAVEATQHVLAPNMPKIRNPDSVLEKSMKFVQF